jgi:hypothetical protein
VVFQAPLSLSVVCCMSFYFGSECSGCTEDLSKKVWDEGVVDLFQNVNACMFLAAGVRCVPRGLRAGDGYACVSRGC